MSVKNKMKIIHNWLNKMKITQKISMTVFCFAFVPMIVFFVFILVNSWKEDMKSKEYIIQSSVNQVYANIQMTVELCNMSTQVVLNNTALKNYLERIYTGEDIPIEEKIQFSREEIVSMERLVNSNPYLYQIRVYVDSENISEMMPILYHKKRIANKKILENEQFQSAWQFDYTDNLFITSSEKPMEHIMSLTSKMSSHTYSDLGYIEVSVRMDHIFPDIFKHNNTKWACLIDQEGNAYYDKRSDNPWKLYVEELLGKISFEGDSGNISMKVGKVGKENVIIASKFIPELNSTYIEVVSMDQSNGTLVRLRWFYICIFICIMAFIIVVIQFVVKTMAKRFYIIFKALKEVQGGNLNVVVPDCGTDELGELANQFSIMLDRIRQLIKDNLDREMLAKNSEIRALQNQINAHFIYNVLESVKMMAEIEEKYDISDAVTSLGIMLRYSMKGLSKNVTVRQEIEYIQNYILLMNLRFDYEIYLSLNIPEVLWEQEIPKMSLQPIVENAIHHGIEDIAEDTNIYIKGIVLEKDFLIEISDQGRGMTEEELLRLKQKIEEDIEVSGGVGTGIGLKNVQDRIQIHFGKNYGLTIASRYGCYTKVSMKIPQNSKHSYREENYE